MKFQNNFLEVLVNYYEIMETLKKIIFCMMKLNNSMCLQTLISILPYIYLAYMNNLSSSHSCHLWP